VHSERYAEWRSTFEQIVATGVDSGEFRAVDPANTALVIVALLDGLGMQTVIGDSAVTVSTAHAILNDYVGSLRQADEDKHMHAPDEPAPTLRRLAR
jgi:hypothetical protein